MTDDQSAENFSIVRIVLKDLSFETPMGQDVFVDAWQPEYDIKLRQHSNRLADHTWEVVLTATVSAKLESRVAVLIEAQQAGVFELADQDEERLQQVLAVEAPKQIFPHLRETVEQVAARGGFPGVRLEQPPFRGAGRIRDGDTE